jgi:hypothetical protein
VFIGHFTIADLSILNDFYSFIEELDIVNKSFVTLRKAFKYEGYRILIRDTMLLDPAS